MSPTLFGGGVRTIQLRLLLIAVVVFSALGWAGSAQAAVSWAPETSAGLSAEKDCDPCVFVWVVRTGNGRVVSDLRTQELLPIDCGTRCQGDFIAWDVQYINLTATTTSGTFLGWNDCPVPNANVCAIPFDAAYHCVKATFSTGTEVVGSCPPPTPPAPPGTGPQTPPPPTGGGLPPKGAACRVFGSPGPDVLTGTPADNRICGGAGNDVIYGLGGDDFLSGGAGNDRLYGQAGRDRLDGGPGNDLLNGAAGHDSLAGGAGRDGLAGGAEADVIDGGAGLDSFSAGGGRTRSWRAIASGKR